MSEISQVESLIIRKLEAAGWVADVESLDFGIVNYYYDNRAVTLQIDHDDETDVLGLSIVDNQTLGEARIGVRYDDNIEELLSLIEESKDITDTQNFRRLLNRIAGAFPEVHVETDEGNWERLSPEPEE